MMGNGGGKKAPVKASIFGLGYVGAVTAGCLAERGHEVIGADVQQAKVDAFNAGLSPIIEPALDDLLRLARREGRLRATMDAAGAVRESDVSLVCVGTPSQDSGRLNLGYVRAVSQEIREALTEYVREETERVKLKLRDERADADTA